ncbi:BTB/POZ domain-containing protein 17-like [Eucyclogobius newberryi]|uniref:BTB/POZ domain-containing protein 17-like n=1 Tax=Eucyclogobius newberryi TaxID=166745 RepID=UPI003B5D05E3
MESGLVLVLVWILATAAGPVSPDSDLVLVHTGTLLDSLLDLFESGSRSDLTLRVQTPKRDHVEILSVHTLILTIHSPVLSHMIQTRKSHDLELTESPETAQVFSKFIRFLYTGELSLVQQEALPLHKLACRFKVSALRRGLSEHMTQSLESDWPGPLVISWLEYAVQMGEVWLRDLCLRALALNLRLVSADFVSFSSDLVLDLVQRSDLVLDSELDLFHAVQTWILTNDPDGLTAESALRAVRYAMIPPQDLFRIQAQSRVLERYQESVRDLLFLSFQFHSGSPLTMSRFLDLNCSLFVPRVYLGPDWGQAWTLPGPSRDPHSLSVQTQLGPSGSDRTRRVLWNLVYYPRWRPLSVAPGQAHTGPWLRTQGPPQISVSPASAGPELAGIQFQKSLLVVGPRNSIKRLCSFHQSSSEGPECLRGPDLDQDLLRVHVVIRPVYHSLD